MLRVRMLIAVVLVCASASAQMTPPPSPARPLNESGRVQSASPTPQALETTGSLTFEEAAALALRQASAYQQSVIDEEIAALDVTQARAALLPKLRNQTTVTYNKRLTPHSTDPAFIAANAAREYQSLIGAEGTLDLGLRAAIVRSEALLAAAHAGTEVARRELMRGLRETYFGFALALTRRRTAEEALAAAAEFERITTLQHDAGEVPEVDVIRARLQTAQRRDELEQARAQEALAGTALRVLVGRPPSEALTVAELTANPNPADIERLATAVPRVRPEITQAVEQARAAHAAITVTRAERFPSLTYSADEGFDAPSMNPDDIRRHSGYLITANLAIPIFDWGAGHAKQRQAELRAKQAANQVVLAQRAADQQKVQAREQALAAVRRVDNARAALADARRNVDISIARYRAGEAPIIEVTDAETTLAQQRSAYQQALYDFEIARGQLLEALGR